MTDVDGLLTCLRVCVTFNLVGIELVSSWRNFRVCMELLIYQSPRVLGQTAINRIKREQTETEFMVNFIVVNDLKKYKYFNCTNLFMKMQHLFVSSTSPIYVLRFSFNIFLRRLFVFACLGC